jgi:hypothetical protein
MWGVVEQIEKEWMFHVSFDDFLNPPNQTLEQKPSTFHVLLSFCRRTSILPRPLFRGQVHISHRAFISMHHSPPGARTMSFHRAGITISH